MKKKKSLWSGVSILIVAVLAITAFIRGGAQLWLLAAAFTAWSIWAAVYFLVPYIKEQLHRYEARRIRKKCERQDAREHQIPVPEESNPVNHVLLRHVNFRISAYLQSIYPDATWEWREEFPEQIVAGGGTALINAIPEVQKLVDSLDGDERTGAKIVLKALEEPVRQIAINAGVDGSVIVNTLLTSGKIGYGYDAYNEAYVDMIPAGIVDPTKVTRSALQNASSVASTVLTTESLVADIKEPAAPAAPAAPDMGGMY